MSISLDDKRKDVMVFSVLNQQGQAKKQWTKSNRQATCYLAGHLSRFSSHNLIAAVVTPLHFVAACGSMAVFQL